MDPSRKELKKFIGARARDVVFITNTTTGVNAVKRWFNFRRADELLTTNHDYSACHNVLVEATLHAGTKLVMARVPFPLRSEDEVVEAVDI